MDQKAEGYLSGESYWSGFVHGPWKSAIDVRELIVRNATTYTGDERLEMKAS